MFLFYFGLKQNRKNKKKYKYKYLNEKNEKYTSKKLINM